MTGSDSLAWYIMFPEADHVDFNYTLTICLSECRLSKFNHTVCQLYRTFGHFKGNSSHFCWFPSLCRAAIHLRNQSCSVCSSHTDILVHNPIRPKYENRWKWVVSIPRSICKSFLSLLCHLVRVVKSFSCWFTAFNIRFKSCILSGGPRHSSDTPSVSVKVQLQQSITEIWQTTCISHLGFRLSERALVCTS